MMKLLCQVRLCLLDHIDVLQVILKTKSAPLRLLEKTCQNIKNRNRLDNPLNLVFGLKLSRVVGSNTSRTRK